MSSQSAPFKVKPHPMIYWRSRSSMNPAGTATFVGLRTLDLPLQFSLLARGTGSALFSLLGLSSIPVDGHPAWDYLPKDTARILPSVGNVPLGDLPVSRLIVLAMAIGSTIKQFQWLFLVNHLPLDPYSAVILSRYNTILNTISTLCLLNATTSSVFAYPRVRVPFLSNVCLSLPTAVGVVLYVVGMAMETGKMLQTGLFGWARHAPYGAYTIWRTGCGLAAGGWVLGAAMALWHIFSFKDITLPVVRRYMIAKHGQDWEEYERKVKWVIVPGIY
ncbi:hypothetical protein QBC34DRAFT_456160 [Podospora aff. communis PSN243]|uniref:Protein-S-isoprenylcysteine O-methyltransferase n=1 Tax=Podospora aff. communis PSN243 TaxID=3040156 RepID=A0AAV9G437_9PEZI|nr:hypothetical protein QBC34DRAFT_456160 [Podospora aff. communis PSN243]